METADDTLALLEEQLKKAGKAVLAAGAQLTAARRQAAQVLERRIQQELRDLDMPEGALRHRLCARRSRRPDGCRCHPAF